MQAWYSGHIVNLRYTAFLFTRSGWARQSALNETDLSARLRTIPAHRMEARTEHIVPLSEAVLAPLTQDREGRSSSGIISQETKESHLSDMVLTRTFWDIEMIVTAVWLGSTFHDWVAEKMAGSCSNFLNNIIFIK